ncbi:MAG: hypothetical protein CUN55_14330 [Phototrophicales bacterium]|nr:MAG: hypothetical protein CUN55_14330 [Phototrophicales bacterium]
MAKKKISYKGKKQYPAYKNEGRFSKNKKRALMRHLKKHPNDEVAKKTMDKGAFEYTRSAPKVRKWNNVEMKEFIRIHNMLVRRVYRKEERKHRLIKDPISYAKVA